MEKPSSYLVYTATVKWEVSKDHTFFSLITLEIRDTFEINFQGTMSS